MSIDTIEKKYNSISMESQTLEDILLKLTDIVRELLNALEKSRSTDELKEKTGALLNKMSKEDASTINREKIDNYLKTVKSLLNEAKKIKSEKESEPTSQALDEDVNIIEQILREELPELPPIAPERPEEEHQEEERVVIGSEAEIISESDIRAELKHLQEYVKMLSDKMFEMGEELLDLKERVMKIEQILNTESAAMLPPTKKEVETSTAQIPEEYREIRELMNEARDSLKPSDENELARGIKMEAIKIRMENMLPELDHFPSEIKNEFESLLEKLDAATVKLRKKILAYSSQHL
ncbi:MAG: hypothetical protein ACP6IP_00580 [Candidatus Njordarchaeia archaeon]